MKTRRSPRNQERLWRELGHVAKTPEPKADVILTDEQIDRLGGSAKRREQFKRQAAAQKARAAIRAAKKDRG